MVSRLRTWLHNKWYFITNHQRYLDQDAARLIGQFYHSLHEAEVQPYISACNDIDLLKITKVVRHPNKITITLSRPGLLIGRRGENIDKLTAFISKHLNKPITIDIIEDHVIQCLYPYDAMEYADDGMDF